jgi:hypothetical protein
LASATPLQINESSFQNNYSNEHLLSENFEEYSEGLQASPFVLTNGIYMPFGAR